MGGEVIARRRCVGPDCGRPITTRGPRQSGCYYTDGTGQRRPLCWDCYDVARGNQPSGRYEHSKQARG